MNRWICAQLALYELFDTVPFAVLAVIPYRARIRSPKTVIFFVAVLYVMGLVRRSILTVLPGLSGLLSVLWILPYFVIYRYVVRDTLPKVLFTLLVVLNYASCVAILYSYAGDRLFPGKLRQYPYCVEASVSILLTLLVTYGPMCYWLSHRVSRLLGDQGNHQVWRTLWLVPAVFCLFFYYSLYTSEDILAFSSYFNNTLFSAAMGAGFFFILSLVLRLVEMSALTTRLMAEKHQLELHTLQYKRLSERMEEARTARHDMRQCMNVLQFYLEKGDIEHLRSYMTQFCRCAPADTTLVYCLHPHLNALICYYSELAVQRGINFEAHTDCSESIPMQDTDLVVLVGNLLENAEEACERQTWQKRFMDLRIRKAGGQLVILLDNSYEGPAIRSHTDINSLKRQGDGLGIASVREIAGRYHGTAQFEGDGAKFSASVVLNFEC